MSDTPRTDGYVKTLIDNNRGAESLEHFARQLERELNAANERIKRLEELAAKLYVQRGDNDSCYALEDFLGNERLEQLLDKYRSP